MDYLLFFWLQDYFMIVDFMTALMQVVNWKVGNMIQVLSNERKWTFFHCYSNRVEEKALHRDICAVKK